MYTWTVINPSCTNLPVQKYPWRWRGRWPWSVWPQLDSHGAAHQTEGGWGPVCGWGVRSGNARYCLLKQSAMMCVKGVPMPRSRLAWKRVANIAIRRIHMGALSIFKRLEIIRDGGQKYLLSLLLLFMQQKYFFALTLHSLRHSPVASVLTSKE